MTTDYSSSTTLVAELRRALRHLYDPPNLRDSLLIGVFGLTQRKDPAAALHRLLLEAIEALKPDSKLPPHLPAWRTHQLLLHRYVEQFAQKEVATNFAVSIRQLRREESFAVQALGDYLRARYDLCSDGELQHAMPPQPGDPVNESTQGMPSRDQELAWLQRSSPSEVTDFEELLQAVLKTADPLFHKLGVRLRCEVPAILPCLNAQVTAVRQALLNVLVTAMQSVPGGQVEVQVTPDAADLRVDIMTAHPDASNLPAYVNAAESLNMARQLVGLAGGSFALISEGHKAAPFAARFLLPTVKPVTVLAVEDNLDTQQLLQRYMTGTRYRFEGAQDAEQAMTLAAKLQPHFILLDVMLPKLDGWQLLERLREHPKTRRIPLIVCTILPQEQLAFALGASGFLRKPFSRDSLLEALDRQLALLQKELH